MSLRAENLIGRTVHVIIDRPVGAVHPRHPHIVYPVNYGHVPDTLSGDGEAMDAYVLLVPEACVQFTGICVAAIRRTHEDDDKLIVLPGGQRATDEEIRSATDFQEKYFESIIIR
jgi:inorganic pyrophosphatase